MTHTTKPKRSGHFSQSRSKLSLEAMESSDPKRVLLVDDDGVTRSVLAKLLEVRGFEVIEADSGGSALRLLAEPTAPRLAVIDWNMGTMNGPELCRILRGRTPYVYVVLTTAREGRKPLAEAMNSGADGYLQKPVGADELEAWLAAGQRVVELHDRLQATEAKLALSGGASPVTERSESDFPPDEPDTMKAPE